MKACRKCRYILQDDEIKGILSENKSLRCLVCNSTDLSDDFSGMVIILDPELSEIAKQLNVTRPGSYALRVR